MFGWMDAHRTWFPLAFAAVGPGLVIGIAIWWWRGISRHRAATRQWTRTEAVVDDASIKTVRHEDTETYQPVIAYRYRVGGSERRGTRNYLVMTSNFNSPRAASAWLARHSPGARVPVWYDPADPDDAALDLSPPSAVVAGCFGMVGLILTAVGIALCFLFQVGR